MNKEEIVLFLKTLKSVNTNIKKLGLFGSIARNADTENRDIDVVVELTDPDMFVMIGIKQDIEEKYGPHVDIVRYRETMNPFLKDRIDSEALYV
jgi:predicted nucleotidyltransferase